jgi:glutamyl-tRNA reductase
MGIVAVGLSHTTAPVTIRERAAFCKEELPTALEHLAALEGITEALILSTCNRVELVVTADREQEGVAALKRFLHDYHALDDGVLDPFLYSFTSASAIRHIFRVACGLDSMVIGECQILGQIKDAYSAASRLGCLGGTLNLLMRETLRVAKVVRSETGISMAGWSISRAAVELAREVFGELREQTVLVIGAGKTSALTAGHLRRSGALKVVVTNRSYDRAAEIAARFQGEAVPFEDLPRTLGRADIVICASSSPAGYLIQRADIQHALQQRRNRPMLFIDIAVPRNVEPSVGDLENACLCDIDGLESIVASHQSAVTNAVQAAEQMLASECDAFAVRQRHRTVGPMIAALRRRLQALSSAELDRHISKLTATSPEDRRRLQIMVRQIANKILHPLIVQVKREAGASPHGGNYVEALALAFTLDYERRVDDQDITAPSYAANANITV